MQRASMMPLWFDYVLSPTDEAKADVWMVEVLRDEQLDQAINALP